MGLFDLLKGTPSDADFIDVIANRDRSKILEFIENGANVNSIGNNGASALMLISHLGDIEIVNALIIKGADVNYKAPDDATALFLACQ